MTTTGTQPHKVRALKGRRRIIEQACDYASGVSSGRKKNGRTVPVVVTTG